MASSRTSWQSGQSYGFSLNDNYSVSSSVDFGADGNDLFHRAVHDAGRWAYGIVFVEVWIMNRARTHLIRPQGGFWLDPIAQLGGGPISGLQRMVDQTKDNYVPPAPFPLGVGLPGILWADTFSRSRSKRVSTRRKSLSVRRASRRRNLPDDLSNVDPEMQYDQGSVGEESGGGLSSRITGSDRVSGNEDVNEATVGYGKSEATQGSSGLVAWREVRPIVQDPDQPYNERIVLLMNCGVGYAAAAPFNIHGHKGIVIYMARDTVNVARLQSHNNEMFLCRATDLIGSSLALRTPRQMVMRERFFELQGAKKRAVNKLRHMIKRNLNLSDILQSGHATLEEENVADSNQLENLADAPESETQRCGLKGIKSELLKIKLKLTSTLVKCKGTNVLPPPGFSREQTGWTFVCVLCACIILTQVNEAFLSGLGEGMPLGPYGALMTLQFGLTAAPASQPRNIILGQSVSMAIALGVANMDSWLDVAFRQSLGTALAIAAMVRLGVIHPPAGAAAFIFSGGGWSWENMGLMLIGNAIAVVVAALFNNLNDKRQYPVFWGTGALHRILNGNVLAGCRNFSI